MPRLFGDGVLVTGDSAGFLNGMRLKGIHLGIKSGMLAAETILDALVAGEFTAAKLAAYRRLADDGLRTLALARRNLVDSQSTQQAADSVAPYAINDSAQSIALHGEITARNGAIVEGNFDAYPVVRMNEAPAEVHCHIMESDAPPGGVGPEGSSPGSSVGGGRRSSCTSDLRVRPAGSACAGGQGGPPVRRRWLPGNLV